MQLKASTSNDPRTDMLYTRGEYISDWVNSKTSVKTLDITFRGAFTIFPCHA